MITLKPGLVTRLWTALHLPLAMLIFQLALDWIDPAQTDKWLELPVLALVGLGAGLLMAAVLPRLGAVWPGLSSARGFTRRVVLLTVGTLFALLTTAWMVIYLVEFVIGFGIQDTPRMLALMPLVVGFYLPVVVVIGVPLGLVNARVLRPLFDEGRTQSETLAAG